MNIADLRLGWSRGLHTGQLITVTLTCAVSVAHAQFCSPGFPAGAMPVDCEETVVTCFGGFTGNLPQNGFDPNGYVLALVDTSNPPAPGGHWCAPTFHDPSWTAANLGQVFGVTLDDSVPPNIYVTATTVYGSTNAAYYTPVLCSQNSAFVAVGPMFGAAGPGGVYEINGTTGLATPLTSLPNAGPALGDVTFDRFTKHLYITNFEDGLIYAVDPLSGSTTAAFDHTPAGGALATTPTVPDGAFAPLGDRPWGLGVLNDRLYYALWTCDMGQGSPPNTVWSVQISQASPSLFVPGSGRLEVTLPPVGCFTGSSPVAGISFSNAGRMMLSERTICGDAGPGSTVLPGLIAHRSRVLEYELVSGTWTPTLSPPRQFNIGVNTGCGGGKNSAGGTDFLCDDTVVSSGDFLAQLTGGTVYGLQLTPPNGNAPNTPTSIQASGVFIDLNNFGGTTDKTRIGDVVVNRSCCDGHCPGTPPSRPWSPALAFPSDIACGDLPDNLAHYSIDSIGLVNNPNGFVSVGERRLPSGFQGLHVICWTRDGHIALERLFSTGFATESLAGTSVEVDSQCNAVVAGRIQGPSGYESFVIVLDPQLLPVGPGVRLPGAAAVVDVQADWLADGTIAVHDRVTGLAGAVHSRMCRLSPSAAVAIWAQQYVSFQVATAPQFLIHDIEQEPAAAGGNLWACGGMSIHSGGGTRIVPMLMRVDLVTGAPFMTASYDFPLGSPWTAGGYSAIKFNPTLGPNNGDVLVGGWSSRSGGPFDPPIVAARASLIDSLSAAPTWDRVYGNRPMLPGTSALSIPPQSAATSNSLVLAGYTAGSPFNNLVSGETMHIAEATGLPISAQRHGFANFPNNAYRFHDITPGSYRVMLGAHTQSSISGGGGSRLWFSRASCPTPLPVTSESVADTPSITGEVVPTAFDVFVPLTLIEWPVATPCTTLCRTRPPVINPGP